tara:strand:+ start:498 stop:734 length:237 start_codon:yes stop_codon:yes gene_type:complete
MANFTSQQDIREMINATEICKKNNIKAYAFYQTNSASGWVVSGYNVFDKQVGDYFMVDTTFDTCRVANEVEFKQWVVN